MKKGYLKILSLLFCGLILLSSCGKGEGKNPSADSSAKSGSSVEIAEAPQFDGKTAYKVLNDNNPEFSKDELVARSYEEYSPLDSLGRCGVVEACIGVDLMPTEERGAIGQVKPTGWHTVKYDIVDGKYLYNRCHLIGFQLSGENANEQNLITGTRYLNIEGMLPFENMVADYVRETKNHVLYRVTPHFKGENLVASGVKMEAMSVEDGGDGICFNIYAYNAQPGVEIDYATGESRLDGSSGNNTSNTSKPASQQSENPNSNTAASPENQAAQTEVKGFVLNISSKKIHRPTCSSVRDMAEHNKKRTYETKEKLLEQGYSACKSCTP